MNSNEVYLFGANGFTEQLRQIANPIGIIDETRGGGTLEGLPIVKLEEVDKSSHIVNCVINSRSYQTHERLTGLGFQNVSFIGDWMRENVELFKHHHMAQAQKGIHETMQELVAKAYMFEDTKSIESLLSIVAFRASLSIKHLQPFETKIDEQYFEDFITEIDFDIFVDAGAYDGSDTLRFVETNPVYEQLFLFEPFTENYHRTSEAVSGLKNATVLQQALGSEEGEVCLGGDGMAARITGDLDGDIVKQTTLDTLLAPYIGKKILVKMDIEGEEMPTLKGSQQLLDDPNVAFAISAYHLPHDLLDILNVFLNSKVKRKLYFRHYSSGLCESVMFAI